MPIDFAAVDLQVDLPDIPSTAPIAMMPSPCLRDHTRTVDGLVDALRIDVKGMVDVPHGYAVGGPSGQVEVFAASGAVRARNTDQIARFDDERRPWSDVVREETDGGVSFRLGDATVERLTASSLRILRSIGLADEHASLDVNVGQWVLLDESGVELESGPGRATVQLGYAAEGIKLIGPGAKTNIHFDPDESGDDGVVARFFHVNRGFEGTTEVRLLGVEQAFEPILTQTWSGITPDPGVARMSVTSAEFGLLALPADVAQRFAAPALAVEGTVSGLLTADGEEATVRFGQYLPLTTHATLAEVGLGSRGPVLPGSVVRGRAKGQ